MSGYHLAHLNVAAMKFAVDAAEMSDFNANLDRVNAVADRSPGFVWRLQVEEGDTTETEVFGDFTLVNMSVWEDIASLQSYVYGKQHGSIMRRRREWFEQVNRASMVLWWIPAGHLPSLVEAKSRLAYLRENGPDPAAFTFKQPFNAPNR